MNELSVKERDPFFIHLLDVIKAGIFVLKEVEGRYKLVATVEGATPQLRETIFQYEIERSALKHSLFRSIQSTDQNLSDINTSLS